MRLVVESTNKTKQCRRLEKEWYNNSMFDYSLRVEEGGMIKLPADVLQHYDLKPGTRIELIERPDGVIEIHSPPADTEPPDYLLDDYPEAEIIIKRNQPC